MKSSIFILSLLISLYIHAGDTLLEGECIADPGSKKYINFNPSMNYPKSYEFTCNFTCANSQQEETVTALHRVVIRSLEGEARDVVCFGVKVKKVSWGYDFDRVDKFFSYEAGLLEITNWAKDEYISLDHENSKYLMDKLIKDLKIILPSYRMASLSGAESSKEFAVAADIIESLLTQLPGKTAELDELVKKIPTAELNKHTGLNLVLRILSSSAKWRLQ